MCLASWASSQPWLAQASKLQSEDSFACAPWSPKPLMARTSSRRPTWLHSALDNACARLTCASRIGTGMLRLSRDWIRGHPQTHIQKHGAPTKLQEESRLPTRDHQNLIFPLDLRGQHVPRTSHNTCWLLLRQFETFIVPPEDPGFHRAPPARCHRCGSGGAIAP